MEGNDLAEELDRFRAFLEGQGAFDEAHWVGVAQSSPTLCAPLYAHMSLRSAQAIARDHGLPRASEWIGAILEFAIRPEQHPS